jgi:predicted Zn-dependent protease
MRRHRIRRLPKSVRLLVPAALAALALPLLLAACASSGVNQGDFNLVSLEEEWQLGQKLEGDLARKLRLVDDRTTVGYVDRLGRQLVAQTEMANLPWEFHVVADPEINAFNIPGGHVYVNTGLLGAAEDVAQLAGVMAHEIAHGVSRHGTEQLTRVYGLNIAAGLLLGQDPAAYEQLLAQIVGAGTIAKFSRGAESEADMLGVHYMYNAGYDPEGMARMFEELLGHRQRQPSSIDQFFASHPLTESRIAQVRREAAKLPAKRLTSHDAAYQDVRRRAARFN